MISFFGTIHQDGGCGTELLGAIELLRLKGVEVEVIFPPSDDRHAVDYLESLGVRMTEYEPGIMKTRNVVMSFGEGEKMFPLIKEDRPKWVVYSDCMHAPCDTEINAFRDGLIDEFFFQTRRMADRQGPEIARRSGKALRGRHGYKAFINPLSDYFPLRPDGQKPEKSFNVLKVCRDHEEKWHLDTWRMFMQIVTPQDVNLRIEIAGWGEEGKKKAGDIGDPNHPFHNQYTVDVHTHVHDPKAMAEIYAKSHVLVHVCDYFWEEAQARVFLESMMAGVVVITDKRGGALDLIRHGATGFLVDCPEEASYYASKMAFEPNLRQQIANDAYVSLTGPGGHANADTCFKWWAELLKSHDS